MASNSVTALQEGVLIPNPNFDLSVQSSNSSGSLAVHDSRHVQGNIQFIIEGTSPGSFPTKDKEIEELRLRVKEEQVYAAKLKVDSLACPIKARLSVRCNSRLIR